MDTIRKTENIDATEVANIVRRSPLGTLAGLFFAGLLIEMLRTR